MPELKRNPLENDAVGDELTRVCVAQVFELGLVDLCTGSCSLEPIVVRLMPGLLEYPPLCLGWPGGLQRAFAPSLTL